MAVDVNVRAHGRRRSAQEQEELIRQFYVAIGKEEWWQSVRNYMDTDTLRDLYETLTDPDNLCDWYEKIMAAPVHMDTDALSDLHETLTNPALDHSGCELPGAPDYIGTDTLCDLYETLTDTDTLMRFV